MGTISFSVCNRLSLSLSLSHTYTQTHAHTGTHTHMQHAYLFFYVTSLILTPLTLRGIPSQFGFVKFVLGLRQNIPLMMLVIVLVLKIAFCLHIEPPPPLPQAHTFTVKLFQDIYIYERRASSCYLPDVSRGLVPYAWELHVGRAKGFIVVKGEDIKLPTPEKKQKLQFIFLIHSF